MQMEQLNKQQIVLLCLLVSFVSSIATGIVTVSLMDQGSATVTQTINRVVEKTIRTVGAATTTKETIVVSEDDAVTDAIGDSEKSLVRIKSGESVVALGIITASDGTIAAYTQEAYTSGLSAILYGGNTVNLNFISRDPETGISQFQAEQSSNPRTARVYEPATLADSNGLKLGQSVVLIGGTLETSVATGIISSKNSERIKVSTSANSFDRQEILVNLLGEVIGLKDTTKDQTYIPSNAIKK